MQQQSSIKYTFAAIVWLATVLVLLLVPPGNLAAHESLKLPGLDKIIHFMLFAILTFLFAKAIEEHRLSMNVWTLGLSISAFAGITEIAQTFIKNRNGDILDLCADVLGVIAVLLILKFTFR